MGSRCRTAHGSVVPGEVCRLRLSPIGNELREEDKSLDGMQEGMEGLMPLTCVCDERQLFGPYLDNLLSGSANKYSPSVKIQNRKL